MARDLIKDYLAHSYLYYYCDEPAISDHEFDGLCLSINQNWDYIQSPFKQFLIYNNNTPPIKGLELTKENTPLQIRQYAQELLMEAIAERERFDK